MLVKKVVFILLIPVCLSRWGGRNWWNSDDPWRLQRLGLDQSTAGSATHMSTSNYPHSSSFCCLMNTIILVKYDTTSVWNRLCFSLWAGLCAEEIHICGEPAAINFIKELMYTTGEEVEVRLWPAAQKNQLILVWLWWYRELLLVTCCRSTHMSAWLPSVSWTKLWIHWTTSDQGTVSSALARTTSTPSAGRLRPEDWSVPWSTAAYRLVSAHSHHHIFCSASVCEIQAILSYCVITRHQAVAGQKV